MTYGSILKEALNPMQLGGILGGGAGALAGALIGGEGNRLGGALIGGGVGAGAGILGGNYYGQMIPKDVTHAALNARPLKVIHPKPWTPDMSMGGIVSEADYLGMTDAGKVMFEQQLKRFNKGHLGFI